MMKTNNGDRQSMGLEAVIRDYVNHSPDNSLRNQANDKAWDAPLVGFSSGADPLYQQLKKDIGPFYWTPLEIFSRSFPHSKVLPEQLTVVSWVLPQNKATRADHRREQAFPSERWTRSRLFGEDFNSRLREHVARTLLEAGCEAVAPALSPLWSRATSDRYGFASTWSERHAAYVSGLGTFGLSDGLITASGKAVRCGSVVARIAVEPSVRPYADHHAYCLFFANGKCKKCAERCPAGAITERGHDKVKCHRYIREVTLRYAEEQFGLKTNSCGLCQVLVPCESRIPVRKWTAHQTSGV